MELEISIMEKIEGEKALLNQKISELEEELQSAKDLYRVKISNLEASYASTKKVNPCSEKPVLYFNIGYSEDSGFHKNLLRS